MSYTILIVDDSTGFRHSVRACFKQDTNIHVCGKADNGADAVERVKQLHPDIVILDLKMPVLDGLRAATQMRRVAPDTKIILFTMYDSKQPRNFAQY